MLVRRSSLVLMLGLGLVMATGAAACDGTGANGQGGSGGDLLSVGGGCPQCQGLECQQVTCDGAVTTTVTGVVYEPAGKIPLYNVVVYVPNAPLDPIPEGASCDKCGSTLS